MQNIFIKADFFSFKIKQMLRVTSKHKKKTIQNPPSKAQFTVKNH